eukprot:m.239315 g.239315  ORF g.239315 m.239315 type:complete len:635 (+) comp13461_c0_seq1:85-1989(+)
MFRALRARTPTAFRARVRWSSGRPRVVDESKIDTSQFGNRTLHAMLQQTIAKHGKRPFLGYKHNGQFEWVSYQDFGQDVLAARGLLSKMGAKKGTAVAIISSNRPEWAACAFASFGLGSPYVPMYEQQQPADWGHILRDSGANVLLVSSKAVLDRCKAHIPEGVQAVLCFEDVNAAGGFQPYAAKAGVAALEPQTNDVEDIACFIYTSGTTGRPKGVELTHRNIVSNVDAQASLLGGRYTFEDRTLNFLPWAHIYGQTVELHGCIQTGASIGCAESPLTLQKDLQLVKPTVLVGVPQFFYRIYDAVFAELEKKPPVARKVFNWAMRVARRRRDCLDAGVKSFSVMVQWKIAQTIVFKKILAKLGGRLRHASTGGAALSREVQDFFGDIGVPIIEGYGLSETSPVVASERYGPTEKIQGGQRALPGVTIMICTLEGKPLPPDTEGEICVAGPSVMKGYHNNPAATAEVMMDVNGLRMFKTGDLGRLSTAGVLTITGRVKEQYKLQNGKYVVPGLIEAAMMLNPYILQACMYGDNRPYNIALVVPDTTKLAARVGGEPGSVLTTHAAEVKKVLLEEIAFQLSKSGVRSYEKIHDVLVMHEAFSQENSMMTPKMSLRRAQIFARYKQAIDDLYASAA